MGRKHLTEAVHPQKITCRMYSAKNDMQLEYTAAQSSIYCKYAMECTV